MIKKHFILFFLFFICYAAFSSNVVEDSSVVKKWIGIDTSYMLEVKAMNEQTCTKCHGHATVEINNPITGAEESKQLKEHHIIDSNLFYSGVHYSFECTDCHSSDYEEYPHMEELSEYAEHYTCLDCHEGDEEYAHYNFEKIHEEFSKSVHARRAEKKGKEFSCWNCHNPHGYRPLAREGEEIKSIVGHNNAICMKCHSLEGRGKRKGVLAKHSNEVPNFNLHLQSVRCIECHTQAESDIMVSHNVLTKESEAVTSCVKCHSENSILFTSLYRYISHENRTEKGFLNSVILNDVYVIGANRNKIINRICVLLFGITMLGIFIHAIKRAIIKTKK